MKKIKIQIKSVFGKLLFEWESKDNTIKQTIEKAIESNADLSEANLSEANLSEANLSEANLSWADLSEANLSKADLSKANLSWANLSEANLSNANLSKADLSKANLSWANLSKANLSEANLSNANLSKADLSKADLSEANLSNANLSEANLSNANNFFNPIDFLKENFKYSKEGLLVEKQFALHYPNTWDIKVGEILTENANPVTTFDCGCGINVANRNWLKINGQNQNEVWQLLIRWEWLPGIIVPINSDGKIRCFKAEIVKSLGVLKELK